MTIVVVELDTFNFKMIKLVFLNLFLNFFFTRKSGSGLKNGIVFGRNDGIGYCGNALKSVIVFGIFLGGKGMVDSFLFIGDSVLQLSSCRPLKT